MGPPIFEQVTSAITVKAICSPIGPDVASGTTAFDFNYMDLNVADDIDPISVPSPVVREDGSIKGIVWCGNFALEDGSFDYDDTRTVDDVSEPLEQHQIISSSTTILDAVEIFGSRPNRYFYVLHVNKLIGVVFYADLFKPLGRLAFLALALEIEDEALSLCRSPAVSDGCWNSLSQERKAKAAMLFSLRHKSKRKSQLDAARDDKQLLDLPRGHSDILLLIDCTHLADKATMLFKQKLVPGKQAEVLGFFNKLKIIRDKCAHPGAGYGELIRKEQLASFVYSAKQMLESLREARSRQGILPPGRISLG